MSEAKAPDESAVDQLNFKDGDYVQEFGYDDDVDAQLRDQIEATIGSELFDDEAQEVVDAVILWWRNGDGDLVDELVDVQTTLDEGGVVWLLTPKAGREGHASPADVQDAAPTAGLHVTTTARVSADWSVTRLAPKRNF